MSGDKLSFLLFFVGTAVAAVMAAIQSTGNRAKVFWAGAIAFAVMGFCYYRWSDSKSLLSVLFAVWSMAPLIAIWGSLIYVAGWQRVKDKPEKAATPAVLNPALTPEFLNKLIEDTTELEAKNRLAEHSNQLMRLTARVKDVKENFFPPAIAVQVIGLYEKYSDPWNNDTTMYFDHSQHDALHVIKRGDFIDFTGRVAHDGIGGWRLVDCVFNGRGVPPPTPKARRAKSAQG